MNKNEFLKAINHRGSSVFANEKVFGMNYVPDIFNYRDEQVNKLAAYCRCIGNNIAPRNLLLTGENATGKTTTLKYFLRLLLDEFSNVEVIYVNCQMDNTPNAIYREIYREVCNSDGAVIGNTNTTLLEKITENLKQTNKILIVCMDDFNRFKSKEGLNDMLYNFLRIHEVEPNVQISIFTISYEEDLNSDSAVRSVFNRSTIFFEQYTQDEMYGILKNRCEYGFRPDVISDDLIMEVAKRAYKRRDIRHGITMLRDAGLRADIEGSSIITKDFL
ncbi:AAA family ATPase [uncultured Methanobrevibacter sp.]|uniref:AAA family ATPase n=1 Tax=uncultured Methanobrevibacter sp. TaxID=253161 RepID=UPI0025CE7A9E|nr:AAA family ATPase [uncultured Methanobrevibacter sp.]